MGIWSGNVDVGFWDRNLRWEWKVGVGVGIWNGNVGVGI